LTHLLGQQLGRYTVQEEIGRGGMARVYRALDTLLKRTVALKVLAPQLAVDPEFAQRFEREAVTAANLRHPNIVTIYDVGEQNGLRYIAMEYVRGRTLHAIIEERGALGLGFAIAIMAPVAAALDYAHSHGAVHRDVKPQNIMVDADGRVLLADFGIAQAPESAGDGQRLTRTGIFMGTPEYISPEQASAQRVDGRSDLYSLGIATYEAITGSVPFSGATPQLIVAHAQKPPPPPSTIDPAQPPELDLVMARILAKRPEQRFASGAGLVEGLRTVARKHGIAVATQQQLAALVAPPGSSAGESTVSLGREPTAPGARGPILPASVPRPGSSAPTEIGPTPRVAAPTMPSRARPAAPPPPPLDDDLDEFEDDPEAAPAVQRRRAKLPEPPDDQGRGNRGTWAIAGLLGGLFLVFLFVIWRAGSSGAGPIVAPTRIVPPLANTQVTVPPTATPTATPTVTPTLNPTQTPTAQPIQETAMPEPPTQRPTRPPAPEPPTEVPPEPPTEPPPDTPTATEAPTVTPSETPQPPTATATLPPKPTPPPKATATTLPPTSTPTTEPASPTFTVTATISVLSATATATETPTTAIAAETSTASPTLSPTPSPTP
jgi:serine/threonine-protein kinase